MAEKFAAMVKIRQLLSKVAAQGREQRDTLLSPVAGLRLDAAGTQHQVAEPTKRQSTQE